jgi:hypothetical protein
MKDKEKQLENVEYFKCLGSLIRSDASCIRVHKSTISMATTVLDREKTLFYQQIRLDLRKTLFSFYISRLTFYGPEIGTLRNIDQKYLGSFETWRWKRMKIS